MEKKKLVEEGVLGDNLKRNISRGGKPNILQNFPQGRGKTTVREKRAWIRTKRQGKVEHRQKEKKRKRGCEGKQTPAEQRRGHWKSEKRGMHGLGRREKGRKEEVD